MGVETATSFCKFNGNGQTYELLFSIDTNIGESKIDLEELNTTNVKEFLYSSSLNKLYLSGKFKYVDNEGKIDKFIDKQICYLNVKFNRITTLQEGKSLVTKVDKEQSFSHSFFVKSIKILSRNNTAITYELDLVGSNWVNLMQAASYTNYANEKADIIKIILVLLKDYAKLEVAKDFMQVISNVKIDYICPGNQSIEECIDYLLSKLYYYDKRDFNLKFLLYDYMSNEYRTKDMATFIDDDTPMWSSIISLTNNGTIDSITGNSKQVNLGTVTSFPRTDEFKMKFTLHMNSYSYETNTFSDNIIDNMAIVGYLNTGNNDILTKQNVDFGNTEFLLNRTGSYWDNELDIYHEAVKRYLNDNAFVVNVPGEICRMPGHLQCISIEKKPYYESSDKKKYDEIKKKFDSILGQWYIGKVVNILNVEGGLYRQNLVLFRTAKAF